MEQQQLATGIRAVCARHPVNLAYLFGSHARGTADAESDVDIALLIDPAITREQRRLLRAELTIGFSEKLAIPIEKLDVVLLQDVPALLQYNVIRTGMVVAAKKKSVRMEFELDVERHYEDEAPFLDREADLTVSRVLAHHA